MENTTTFDHLLEAYLKVQAENKDLESKLEEAYRDGHSDGRTSDLEGHYMEEATYDWSCSLTFAATQKKS